MSSLPSFLISSLLPPYLLSSLHPSLPHPQATGDPYYLDIGKSVVNNLNDYARVSCGFAAIKDLKTNDHEDRMDSFVLAETFKYLYLLFAEEDDLVLDLNDFLFSTEAHLLPLSLATLNTTFDPRTTVRIATHKCT